MTGAGQGSVGKGPINSTSLFMYSPRSSTGSDRSSGSFRSGGSSHLHDWPLGRSALHERYIKPVPPMYVTEYEANFTWPKMAVQPNVSSKMSPWQELEQAAEELADLERKYPAIIQVGCIFITPLFLVILYDVDYLFARISVGSERPRC